MGHKVGLFVTPRGAYSVCKYRIQTEFVIVHLLHRVASTTASVMHVVFANSHSSISYLEEWLHGGHAKLLKFSRI